MGNGALQDLKTIQEAGRQMPLRLLFVPVGPMPMKREMPNVCRAIQDQD
jgi:hypothetical protein